MKMSNKLKGYTIKYFVLERIISRVERVNSSFSQFNKILVFRLHVKIFSFLNVSPAHFQFRLSLRSNSHLELHRQAS